MSVRMNTMFAKLNKHRTYLIASLAAGSLLLLAASLIAFADSAPEPPTPAVHPRAAVPERLSTTPPASSSAEVYVLPLPFDPPANRLHGHPLEGVIAAIRTGKSTETRDWVLPLLVKALAEPMRVSRITGYSSRDADGGGPYTRWGTRVRWGICAADPRYWGPGSVIWMGDPVNQVLVVEDTGGAIKGRHRFDVCCGDSRESSARIGRRKANYVPLYVAPPTSRWGHKPKNWQPPLPPEYHAAKKAAAAATSPASGSEANR
jgi:3D (Asp-Asp-Asp) domain-containing protein